jgi:uncharacterized protein YgiM (DUF1202 family)
VAIIAMLLMQALAPAIATAAELSPQTEAVIANAGGDHVRLRSGPGSDTEVRALLSEGSRVLIDAGPESAEDGSTWYQVAMRDGSTGYVAAEFVSVATDQPPPEQVIATTTDKVNLRAGPSLGDAVLQSLDAGTKVSISGESIDGWFAVSIDQTMGFIHGDYLTQGTPEVDAKAGSGTRYVLETLRMRTGPGTSYRIMDTLPVGLRLEFTGQTDGSFAKVSSSRGTGWVAARYIGPVAPGGTGSSGGGTRYTTDSVRLRSGPGTSYRVLANLPSGATLTLVGGEENGFAKVSTSRGTGWVSTQYIGSSASSTGTRAYTNDSVSLRSGPGSDYRRLAKLSTGATLTLTGETSGSYSKVRSNAGTGWVATSYISSVAPQYTGGTRYTIDSVNLRRGPGTSSSAIRVIPARTEIHFTGTVVNNFGKVATSYGDGWISIDYFRKTRPSSGATSGGGSSLVVWPVKGGEWYVSQGYNGSSHQNQTRYWQYYYSFDLKRSSGGTAWQAVYAPVSGRIRWIDESTGGMSIYMGDGLAFAMFHVLWASSIREGQSISQGQYLGVIAPSGVANNGGSPHIHITAWTTADEGNWSRFAQPFTGRFAIEGVSFPSTGKRNDYLGYSFNP